MRPRVRRLSLLASVGVMLFGASGCSGGGGGDSLTIYSGRSEDLVGPLLDQFAEQTGIDIAVRYGDSAELALRIQQEGDQTDADVFLSQSPGALGLLDEAGMLGSVPPDVLDLVPETVRASDGGWVGVSGRQRVLIYNTDALTEADLPDSVLDLVDPSWKGRIGIAPSNGSFQDFVSVIRENLGDDAARAWLVGIAANDPVVYANNNAIAQAVGRGEVDAGLVNHYYNYRLKAELGDDQRAANYVFPDGDVGSTIIVTGATILAGTDQADDAASLLRFLLSAEAQGFYSEQTFEYPLAAGVQPPLDLPPLDFDHLGVDLDLLGTDLTSTLDMIRETGLQG